WSPAQREKFLNAFARFMVATHASRFDGAANQGFAIEGSEDAQSGRKIVHARYLRAQRPTVAIDYLVQPTNDGWRILDVYLDQTISLLALHRSEFSSVLRDRGFDGFIAALHAKADEIAARPVAN
ncbi:MAG: ABC transporter substrate-binding protein, partial [Alphaproteobacteria bacterium]